MRHRMAGKKLGRDSAHRVALKRNLVRSLFLSFGERNYIVTTKEKAKFARPFAEKLITLAREKTLSNYRRGIKLLRDEDAVHRLFEEIGPSFRDRPGGYTRILRTPKKRLGDAATQVLFGFVREGEARPEEADAAGAAEA